ncbi:MAG: CDGSH iron-sulfur domain-containing protein [Actinomycetales bacterium]|nr:CDGSH iron-sulfur domain-containing protein [Actinomycetales bacterium]
MSDERVVITPLKDGPNQVTGGVVVQDPDGNVIKEASTVYLCRCGFSQDKPFCDGSHRRNGWTEASGE